ncbi:hypothetical protein MY11210_009665 [Beauveria gryllotalpidicola]
MVANIRMVRCDRDSITLKYQERISPDDDTCDGEMTTILGAEYRQFGASEGEEYFLTYGMVNALAGDFFAVADRPISDGTSAEGRQARFSAAFRTLKDANVASVKRIAEYMAGQQRAYQKFLDGELSADEWADKETSLLGEAFVSGIFEPNGFLALVLNNFDHFAEDARKSYAAGHAVALREAAAGSGTYSGLKRAYFMNAFADHYLEDQFSAGHMRTRVVHCTKMHDEECKLGLLVSNERGNDWMAHADNKLLVDESNKSNFLYCQEAVQTSADEIYNAWITGEILEENDFAALKIAPSRLWSTGPGGYVRHTPLFQFVVSAADDGEEPDKTWRALWRRANLDDPKKDKLLPPGKWTPGGTLRAILPWWAGWLWSIAKVIYDRIFYRPFPPALPLKTLGAPEKRGRELSFDDGAVIRVQRSGNTYNVDQLSSTPFLPLKAYELNWSLGPITLRGYVDTTTFEAGLHLTVIGIDLANIKGNLKDGIILNINLVLAKGSLKFYLKGKQMWVRVDIDVKIDGKYHEDHKIVDFGSASYSEE